MPQEHPPRAQARPPRITSWAEGADHRNHPEEPEPPTSPPADHRAEFGSGRATKGKWRSRSWLSRNLRRRLDRRSVVKEQGDQTKSSLAARFLYLFGAPPVFGAEEEKRAKPQWTLNKRVRISSCKEFLDLGGTRISRILRRLLLTCGFESQCEHL